MATSLPSTCQGLRLQIATRATGLQGQAQGYTHYKICHPGTVGFFENPFHPQLTRSSPDKGGCVCADALPPQDSTLPPSQGSRSVCLCLQCPYYHHPANRRPEPIFLCPTCRSHTLTAAPKLDQPQAILSFCSPWFILQGNQTWNHCSQKQEGTSGGLI